MVRLGEELGRGSSGKVYRALNRETGDFRAIKEIPIRDVPVARLQAVIDNRFERMDYGEAIRILEGCGEAPHDNAASDSSSVSGAMRSAWANGAPELPQQTSRWSARAGMCLALVLAMPQRHGELPRVSRPLHSSVERH